MDPLEMWDGGDIAPFIPRLQFAKKYAFAPQRCADTGERIWLSSAWCVTFEEQWGHIETYWLTEDAYVTRKLSGISL